MFRASSKTFATQVPGTINLEISDPVLMLNEVAKRYESVERVLMEYVDNALDDAEQLYQENAESYPYLIRIDIKIDPENRALTVQDNCRGMTRDTLERVVRNVGESQKRGQTWVNGRFGFGVHAFRAAAEAVSFQTKHARSSFHTLTLQRDQHRNIKEAKRHDDAFPTDSGTGCIVSVLNIDPEWFQSVSVTTIKREIERHFERLLARPNLQITVCEDDSQAQVCHAYDYAKIPGVEIRHELSVAYKETVFPVTVFCKIAENSLEKCPVSFFARDRRIGDVADIKSFMRKSVYKTSVWNHPNLMGYIEVGEIVQPIINRDDFVRTRGRTLLYAAVLPLEAEIKALLTGINQQRIEHTFAHLEQTLQQALTTATSEGFDVHLGDDADEKRRSWMENGRLHINSQHPDFQARLRLSRQGSPQPSDRLNAYLAALLALYATTSESQTAELQMVAQIELMSALELQLRQLQKK